MPPYPTVAPHKFACLMDLFVAPSARRCALGRRLLDEAKHWAYARSLEYLELMVLENNADGRSFYERERFKTASQTMSLEL